MKLSTTPSNRLEYDQVPGPGLDAFPSSVPVAPAAPTASAGLRYSPPQPTNTYATTPSPRNGGNHGSGRAGGSGGMAGGATATATVKAMAVARNLRKPHESPVSIAPIAVTVSRTRRSGSNAAGRPSTGGVATPVASAASVGGGNGGRENGEGSTGRSTGRVSLAVRAGWSGGGEKERSGVVAGPATPYAPPRTGETGVRPVDGGGGTGVVGGEVSAGFGCGDGGEEGGDAEDVEDVAKKLDFHAVFD